MMDVGRRSQAVFVTLTRRTGSFHHKTAVQPHQLVDPFRGQQVGTNADFSGPTAVLKQGHVDERRIEHNVSVVAQEQHALVHAPFCGVPGDPLGGLVHQTLEERLDDLLLKRLHSGGPFPAGYEMVCHLRRNQLRQIAGPISGFHQRLQCLGRLGSRERGHVLKASSVRSAFDHAAR